MKGRSALMTVGALVSLSLSAHAQVPQGSYLRTCKDIRMEGRTLVAVCRRADGREQRTAITEIERCIGDIGNINGVLQCHRGRLDQDTRCHTRPRRCAMAKGGNLGSIARGWNTRSVNSSRDCNTRRPARNGNDWNIASVKCTRSENRVRTDDPRVMHAKRTRA